MDDDGERPNALLAAYGLTDRDFVLFERLFTATLAPSGLDGGDILDALARGHTPREALGLPAGIIDVVYARAHQWFTVGRADRAEPLFRALCVLAVGEADHWLGLGICMRLRGDLAGAETSFSAAARLRPGWAIPQFHAAELYMRQGRRTDAARALEAFRMLRDDTTPQPIVLQAARYATALDQSTAERPTGS
ncbi:hypothetical protein [Chthonobacter rhizosphaerae]|uniref:hypothetical protein n=1 Tax=Chthonobacter rhizosphaerae TaxID=2735553 RepID=UPI0015EEA055|nr:hypothetical protein [Chthonobacter rhizosphaerae]